MAKANVWEFDPTRWPAKFGRKWLWTIFSESVHHARVVSLCQSMGITDLAILVNDSPIDQPTWSVRTGVANTVKLSQLAQAAGISVHLGTWLDPKKDYVFACAEGMAALATEAKASSIILDLEGEWRKRISDHTGFVASVVAPAFSGFPTPIGITSFAVLPREVAPALAWAVKFHKGYGQPQAYSVFQDKSWQKSARLAPDSLPTVAWRSWSPITRRLVCLQAAYGDPMPGRTISGGEWTGKPWGVVESIQVAAQRAQDDGFPSIGWWSEEALARNTTAASDRRAVITEIQTTGKSLVGRAWRKAAAVVGAAALAIGGVVLIARRGR